jgi:hypothetical protein
VVDVTQRVAFVVAHGELAAGSGGHRVFFLVLLMLRVDVIMNSDAGVGKASRTAQARRSH